MTDINLGVYTARLDPARSINATSEKLSIRYHNFEEVRFKDFLHGLIQTNLPRRALAEAPSPEPVPPFAVRQGARVTVQRFFQRLNTFLEDRSIVIADVGDALFGAADLCIHRKTEFLGPAYYASMGFAVPAAIGAELANPELRPVVLVGDGAFQMTGQELSTMVRHGLRPIVIVFNNGGYGTERHMQDGPYNDVLPWHYSRIPEVLGAGCGIRVETEEQLEEALAVARNNTSCFTLIDLLLDPADRSPALGRLAERLGKNL